MPLVTVWIRQGSPEWVRQTIDPSQHANFIEVSCPVIKPDVYQSRAFTQKPRTDYARACQDIERDARFRANREAKAQLRSAKRTRAHRKILSQLAAKIHIRAQLYFDAKPPITIPGASAHYTTVLLDDHSFIKSMFDLYSQQRYRLLQ